MSANPVDPQNFPGFAPEPAPTDTYTVAYRVVLSVMVVVVDVVHVVGEPAARAVFAFVDERYPESRYIHIQS